MLEWLDADEDRAAQKYEFIRGKLIKFFELRGCLQAEDLADTAFDRVAAKIETLAENYVGNPAAYFYGVARNILLENRRQPKFTEIPPQLSREFEFEDEIEKSVECLRQCLARLAPEHKTLIIEYYSFKKSEKFQTRRTLAEKINVSIDTLRTKVFRIREKLQKCAFQCLES